MRRVLGIELTSITFIAATVADDFISDLSEPAAETETGLRYNNETHRHHW